MIILHTHLYFFQGGSKMLLELCKEILPTEPILLIIDNGEKEHIKKFTTAGIKVLNLEQKSTNNLTYWLFFPYFFVTTILKLLKLNFHHESILSSTYPSHFIALTISKIKNFDYYAYCFEPFPFFYSQNFIWNQGFLKGLLYSTLSLFLSWSDKISIRRAKKVFTLNQITQKTIKKIYNAKAIITLMGVDTKHFNKKRDAKIEKQYADKKVVIHSTDYSYMKRTDLAIIAISKVVKKIPEILLLITTTKPDSKEKQALIKMVNQFKINDNVKFLNFVNYNDLPVYYSLAKCYLSCSYDEMLGTTSSNLPVKEAMSCMTPAIRSNITTEDVEDGKTGFLVNSLNTAEVAEKIVKLASISVSQKEKMGTLARKKIVDNYNWKNVANVIKTEMKLI